MCDFEERWFAYKHPANIKVRIPLTCKEDGVGPEEWGECEYDSKKHDVYRYEDTDFCPACMSQGDD